MVKMTFMPPLPMEVIELVVFRVIILQPIRKTDRGRTSGPDISQRINGHFSGFVAPVICYSGDR